VGHYQLGALLQADGQLEEALAAYQQALAISPHLAEAACQTGTLLLARDDAEGGVEYLSRAVADRADFAKAHNNLGGALFRLGRFSDSIASLNQAISLRPDYAEAHWNLGLTLLMQGDFEAGWTVFRLGWPHQIRRAQIPIPGPLWDGTALAGRRILIHNLWGLGDAIQMARFLPRVAEMGGRVTCYCHPGLHRILRQIPGVERWISLEKKLPECDVQCPLILLAAILNATPADFSAPVPYLRADDSAAARWKSRLPADGRVKAGLVWANNPSPANRCPRPEDLSPLAELKNVWFCSLQKELYPKMTKPAAPRGLELADWTNELNDLADTAALIANLDLVITVDTAVAHLAGAMGRPVWLILQHVPDWRWLMDRRDSPWYPTMRLFRQPSRGDWAGAIVEVKRELAQL
jgi:hypothetical protein